MESLIRPLLPGPFDVVGDVHGEIGPLETLLERLGYRGVEHPEGRRLVFVGDLTDRGADSVAVVELVAEAVRGGHAQCVLGNHDLNILLGHAKVDNAWFFQHQDPHPHERVADARERRFILDFFAELPLALARDDARVVHACWDDRSIRLASRCGDARSLHDAQRERIDHSCEARGASGVEEELEHQNDNAVKLLTSGPEEVDPYPKETNGKLRRLRRVEWWHGYDTSQPTCVFGHYALPAEICRDNLQAVCVDFGAYKRRLPAAGGRPGWRLGALRLPERTLVFDTHET